MPMIKTVLLFQSTANNNLPRLTFDVCSQIVGKIDIEKYDLGGGACQAVWFSFPGIPAQPVDNTVTAKQQKKKNLQACAALHEEGKLVCKTKPSTKLAQQMCERANFVELSACKDAVESVSKLCKAAALGHVGICYDIAQRFGAGSKRALQSNSTCNPCITDSNCCNTCTPCTSSSKCKTCCPPLCTSCCVNACVAQYYEPYDYNAEQLCYYDTCLC